MAHVVFMTRGIKHDVDWFINELSTRYLPFRFRDKDNKMIDGNIQMRVCPIQLWDVSFPTDQKDAVYNTIFASSQGKPEIKSHGKFISLVRKIMKLNPLPEYSKEKKLAMRPPQNIEIVAIGVKEDYWINEKGEKVSYEKKDSECMEGI